MEATYKPSEPKDVFTTMALSPKALLIGVIILICGVELGQSSTVDFYLSPNYTDLLEEAKLRPEDELKCINIHSGERDVRSVKTDKCLVVYARSDCKWNPATGYASNAALGASYYRRFDKSTPNTLQSVGSFHVCSQKLGGGPQLDIDIYPKTPTSVPLRERGVCGCRNVPSEFAGGKSFLLFINNHANSVNLYADENCSGNTYHMEAGLSYSHWYAGLPFDVKSFRPADLTPCNRVAAHINILHFSNQSKSTDHLPVEKIHVGMNTLLENNGSAYITQMIRVKSNVTESVQFSVVEPFTELEVTDVDTDAKIKAEGGVPLLSRADVQRKVAASYKWSKGRSYKNNNTIIVTTEHGFDLGHEIKLIPCAFCTVARYLEKVQNFSIKYQAYAKVLAVGAVPPLSVEDLRQNLPAGLKYVEVVNRTAIEALTEGLMTAEFGWKVVIDVRCVSMLPGPCVPDHINPDDYHQVYEIPLRLIGHGGQRHRSRSGSQSPSILSFLRNSLYLLANSLR